MADFQRYRAAFSVDVEDYYHPELVRRYVTREERAARVEASTAPILDLLDRHGVQGTFFIVGEIIRDAAPLVRRIVRSGHEVGCHTHTHRPLWEHTPESLRREIRDFKSALFEVAGDLPVRGFRAPTFSLDTRTAWALRVLEEEGFTYDSSIVPVRGPLYGCPGAPLGVYRPSREDLRAPGEDGALVEFPAPLARWGGKSIPVGGGFYLRTLPFFLYQGLVRGVLRRRPFFLYVHPWETDPATPRIQIPRLARWATYAGIRGALGKIDHLLRTIRFTTMQSVIQAAGFGV